jgi:hypothetical protein
MINRFEDFPRARWREKLAAHRVLSVYDPEGRYEDVVASLAGPHTQMIPVGANIVTEREDALEAFRNTFFSCPFVSFVGTPFTFFAKRLLALEFRQIGAVATVIARCGAERPHREGAIKAPLLGLPRLMEDKPPDGRQTDARRTPNGRQTDAKRTPDGRQTDSRPKEGRFCSALWPRPLKPRSR